MFISLYYYLLLAYSFVEILFVTEMEINITHEDLDDDLKTEKHFIDFYESAKDISSNDTLRRLGNLLLCYVCDEPAEKHLLQNSINLDIGWCTDFRVIYTAMNCHLDRAKGRLQSLVQIYELLVKSQKESATTVLSCIHQQLLTGCFSLNNLKAEEACTQLHHYLEGVQVAPHEIKEEITSIVHNIYKLLIRSLADNIENEQNKHLQLLTTFALSTRFEALDLSLVIDNDLMALLTQMCSWQVVPSMVISKGHTLNVASLRLLHILAMSCRVHAKCVDLCHIEKIIGTMYEQLQDILENNYSNYADVLKHFPFNRFIASYSRVLGDFLVFLRTVASSHIIQKILSTKKWIDALLSIVINKESGCNVRQVYGLRPKLLALQLLQTILSTRKASDIEREHREYIIKELFNNLAEEMWREPVTSTESSNEKQNMMEKALDTLSDSVTLDPFYTDVEENLPVHDTGFDPEKCCSCSVEGSLTLVHGPGGRGYGLGTRAIKSGCYQWKILIVKENKGNEGTCIGVSKYPIKDFSHRTTSDMWLYRAYSGGLYHNGEKDLCLQSYTQGDYITVVLDMDAKTLSFGKNGEEPRVAFENIEAAELYPCVMFYSTNPGEKVKMTDMQVSFKPKLK